MGDKCALCGYNKCISALELHHLDPNEKEYGLSSGNCKNLNQDIEEIKKCILVCANCHREIHSGLIDYSLTSSFDESKAKEILNNHQKSKQQCIRCGKQIEPRATYCEDCLKFIRREKALKIRPSRDILKQEIRTMPFTQIGFKYNVTDNAIRKWCDDYNLPRTKKQISNYSNSEWEKI